MQKAIEIAMKVIQKDVNNERIFDVYVKAIEQHKKWSNIRDFLHILKVKKAEKKYGVYVRCICSYRKMD